jgi:transcriptional regulator with XRE-family HTH domain
VIGRGELAYVCARNRWQVHSLLIRAARDSGLSQEELAKRTGMDEATISRVLARPRNLDLDTVSKMLLAAGRGAGTEHWIG